jgi:hypothetical protein
MSWVGVFSGVVFALAICPMELGDPRWRGGGFVKGYTCLNKVIERNVFKEIHHHMLESGIAFVVILMIERLMSMAMCHLGMYGQEEL